MNKIDQKKSLLNNWLEHKYSKKIHILSSSYLQTLLTTLCLPTTNQPLVSHLIEKIYNNLFIEIVNLEMNYSVQQNITRMHSAKQSALLESSIIDFNSRVVICSVIRAGILPSDYCFNFFHDLIDYKNIRQDHFFMNRKTNDKGEVLGVDVSGSKIGGDKDKAYVIIPDPMAATGSSMGYCLDHYEKNIAGTAIKYIVIHLIVTPEYIRYMSKHHPNVEIYAVRVDRGMSSQEILKSVPGTYLDREKGLNSIGYIVPGAGGIGEVINNSFV